MLIIFCFLCIIMILTLRIHFKGIDRMYLSKDNTQVIKGVFIIIVFLSHIKGYADFFSQGDIFVKKILTYLGQLMVAYFLFTSGYGVLESIKKKGREYVLNMPKNRIGKTFFDFSLAIILFLILDLIIEKSYSGSTIILAFTGWTSIGNSNWYMFAIFTLYIITYICFLVFERSIGMSIIATSILALIYIYILSGVKDNWWSDTYLCYVGGMWFSYYKNKIDYVFEKIGICGWSIAMLLCTAGYIYISAYRNERIMAHNIVAVWFCVVIVLFSMKVSFKSRILRWCGENLFWLYILQRLPMIFLQHYGINIINSYLYLGLCLIGTVVLTLVMNKVTNILLQKTWWT